MADILTPEEVDERWKLPRGRAQRLARKGVIPAQVFPDGTVRFNEQDLVADLKTRLVKEQSK